MTFSLFALTLFGWGKWWIEIGEVSATFHNGHFFLLGYCDGHWEFDILYLFSFLTHWRLS